jgi:hypothetical protein
MATRKSAPRQSARPALVSAADLAHLIRALGTGKSLELGSADLADLKSALQELQQRRGADANRTAGIARATAKRRAAQLDELHNWMSCTTSSRTAGTSETKPCARPTRHARPAPAS